MKNNLDLSSIIKPINDFLARFHLVTFVVVVVGGLSAATFLFYEQIFASQDIVDSESIETTMPDFDKATIERLNELKQSSETSTLEFPSDQRVNPFTE